MASDSGRPTPPAERSHPVELSSEELERYSRHLKLPEVGRRGQEKLRRSKVLIVGAGGLGAPSALYLAAAGVGEIGLVDSDRVELSNLQRQVLYSTSEVGEPKVDAAGRRLAGLNPGVLLTAFPQRLTSENAFDILRPYDLVIDGSDNFPTRYLVNDACVLLGKPNVYGSVYRFEGQASVFDASRGPCYRCLFPEPPPPGFSPSCADAGVLGVLPGIIGLVQAVEALKLLLGQGEPLVGRLLLFDALAMRFRELKLGKSPECVVCGPNATQTTLIDYPAFCGESEGADGDPVPETTVEELAAALAGSQPPALIDVRDPEEWEVSRIPGAIHIPLAELAARASEVPADREIVVYCESGIRSRAGTRLLVELGIPNVRTLRGGRSAWARRADPPRRRR
ncbi:MAG: molybdopterin-synthase adenylyltransferase MoeB [Thermoplasmata archaeon]|nr:molybdopterin-synthase adenylyltransferase MoeB [Thermoplasmata archaeon]